MIKKQKIILGGSIFAVILIIFFGIQFDRTRVENVNLEFWGINDSIATFKPFIDAFNAKYPHVTISYVQKDVENYEQELNQSFITNESPDIFMIPSKWIPMHYQKISPLTLDREFNQKMIRETYPEVIETKLISENKVYGLPLYFDNLGLYYNRDLFDEFNIIAPPQTWEEVVNLIPQLRKIDERGNIIRAAIALGTENNVKWASQIIESLIMQHDNPLVNLQARRAVFNESILIDGRRSSAGIEALSFFTRFSNSRDRIYTWNREMPDSLRAFSFGQTAMFIGSSSDRHLIRQINPRLNFGIAELPFFERQNIRTNSASIMTLTVSRNSKNHFYAWEFIKSLNEKDNAEKYFLETKKLPFRRDLIVYYKNDPDIGDFISQILVSRGWYQPNYQKIEDIFQEMIRSATIGRLSPEDAIQNAIFNINNLLR